MSDARFLQASELAGALIFPTQSIPKRHNPRWIAPLGARRPRFVEHSIS